MKSELLDIINTYDKVSLEELDKVKLQNRVDSKYLLHISQLHKLLKEIKDKQYVLEIEGTRIFTYKTNYFDTPDFQFYKDHHNGCINRVKVRAREYVENKLNFFEIKRKLFGTRTDKKRKKISNLLTQISPENYELIQYKRLANKPLELKIRNEFNRITLTNNTFTERITIDTNIKISNGTEEINFPNIGVIEVKQSKTNVFSHTIQVLKALRIYPSQFSKYAIAVALLVPQLKHNFFKPILLKLNKINHAGYDQYIK